MPSKGGLKAHHRACWHPIIATCMWRWRREGYLMSIAEQVSFTESTSSTTEIKRVVVSSVIGTAVEWYDFLVYGMATALVFNKLFFPLSDPALGIIAAFGTYAVGFLARPLGAVIFGHFGDRVRRQAMLAMNIIIMGPGTFLIGLLPTYDQIGIA